MTERNKSQISRRDFALSTSAALLAAPFVSLGQTKTTRPPTGTLSDEFLQRIPTLMQWANVPGIAIAIIKEGHLSWSQGFGVKKAGEKDAVDSSTLFGAASLSKPVFAYAILKMREEKLIDIDRPLWNYLPYPDLPEVESAKLITARHVLSHSTGLQNWRFQRDQKLEFGFKPGERFGYSGEGFYYLQRVLEQITGSGFEDYLRERVLKPLGMTSSTYLWISDNASRVAWGHSPRAVPSPIFNAETGPKMLEIAREWKKRVETWKYEDVARAHGVYNKFLPPFPNFLLPNTAGSLITWGIGVGLERDRDRTLFWHWGDNGTFKAFMMGDPVKRSGIVVFTNGSNGHRLWRTIVAEATGSDHAAFYFFMT